MNGQRERVGNGPVASPRHTLILVAILLGIALAGYLALQSANGAGANDGGGGAGLYLSLIAAEWGLLAYVRAGLRRGGNSVLSLLSDRPLTARALLADLLLGAILFAALIGAERLMDMLIGAGDGALVQRLLVRDAMLVPLWIVLALSAGFVEEVTFRGYLQRQLGAWCRSPWLGVLLQAALFGVTHGYQGGVLIARITMLALIFGAMALLRRSLVPGILAHAALDIFGGLQAMR
jgi:membrane protease YdiL (CAAX protease family)